MKLYELFALAVGLSMDAFAVAVCAGLAMPRAALRKAAVIGLYFGAFQAAMPICGHFAATWLADKITAFDHWIAFALLCFLGGKMAAGSLKKDNGHNKGSGGESCDVSGGIGDVSGGSLRPSKMLPLAVATSIDALAVGVSFAFLRVDIVPAASFIGLTTFLLSMLGVKAGNMFGAKLKSKAELAGGVILILIGAKILADHLFFN